MRSLIKTATFASVHFTVAFSVAYALTGSVAISSTLALVEPMVNTVAYFFHERVWEVVDRVKQQRSSGVYLTKKQPSSALTSSQSA